VKVTIRITATFKAAAKPLLKKYSSLSKDLLRLEKELLVKPKLGAPIGPNAFKIRLRISSKGKGKSGGARIITLIETETIAITEVGAADEITVNLLTIYDKSETATISDKELKELIQTNRRG
jgi:mRNA-degrading endonuclease RelE of RelBE toxin-antitoxin system